MAADVAARFEAHIEVCPPCGVYLEQMRTTLGALGRIPEESISQAARAELLRTFEGWRSG
jgi:hypothetical protein